VLAVYHWLHAYIRENPIPLMGAWDEVSGDAFLRKMLQSSPETTCMVSTGLALLLL
jgi:hypothetical protein